jgi:hypothetical protein
VIRRLRHTSATGVPLSACRTVCSICSECKDLSHSSSYVPENRFTKPQILTFCWSSFLGMCHSLCKSTLVAHLLWDIWWDTINFAQQEVTRLGARSTQSKRSRSRRLGRLVLVRRTTQRIERGPQLWQQVRVGPCYFRNPASFKLLNKL